METNWSADVTQHLMDRSACPRCGVRALELGWCRNCAADLSTAVAHEIWDSSLAAVRAIEARQTLIGTLTSVQKAPAAAPPPPPFATASGSPTVVTGSSPPPPVGAPAAAGASSQVSVQSVLAVAGSGLFAVAAIVFTFFNPDVDYATRTAIIAIVTALFLGGAWLFASRGLTFSAEAVGALGMVFLALDVWAFADAAPPGVNGWTFAAIGTLVASSLMIAVATLVRLRVWLWLSLIGLALTPAFFGYATENWWGATIGHLGAAFVGLGAHELARRLSDRFGSELKADRIAATVVQFLAGFLVIVAIGRGLLPEPVTGVFGWTIGVAAILGGLAVLAGLSTRNEAATAWSALTGALAVTTVGILPHAINVNQSEWELALVPLAAAIAFVAVAFVRQTGSIRRMPLLAGALVMALIAAVPAVVIALSRLGTALFLAPLTSVSSVDWWSRTPELWIAATAGVASAAAGVWGASRFTTGGFSAGLASLARWIGGLALLTAAVWPGVILEVRVAAELGVALLVSAALLFIPRFRSSRASLRVPLIVTAFAGLVIGVAMSWEEQVVAVVAGAAALGVLVAIAYTMPRAVRPVLMGLGFAYSLVVFANALDLTVLEPLPILCLTATFGSTVALAATLTPWLRPGTWYAVLIVTTIPFLIAVGVLFVEIRGWTALSTGVTFLLALALVITRRQGLTIFLRAAAAALLVPSLSVVVIALGAQFLDVSASPITLPIIAVIVAAVLPTTGLIAAALVGNGLSEAHAHAVRLWIEISTLVTAGIAVVLAFVRDAAGPETAFLVFVIVGIGAAATAIWAGRRYGWIVAGIAWTGGLWTALGILDVSVTVIEPYALPPALAAAVVGAILVARGQKVAVGLYATGLAAAVASSLVVLAIGGSGAGVELPWRAFGLLAGSALLLALGALIRGSDEKPSRFLLLRRPTLVIGIAAAASGAIQSIRYGTGIEPLPTFLDPTYVMLTVLAFALVAAALATGAGRVAVTGPGARAVPLRWWFLAAAVYLVAGPMSAISPAPLDAWTVWSLMMVLLGLLVVTALRARDRAVTLPPIWFTFALAWSTGVAGWSQREVIRLEGWSIPMGVALLAAGVIAMPRIAEQFGRVNLNSWPIGFRGSWKLLSPGILVVLLPSIIATTFTDASTWRAILVITLALVSVLAGAFLRLRAPFILGLIALPLEILVVFIFQISRGVESIPWWITLAAAGAVLLAIAVRAERRTGKDASTGARLSDLE